MLNRYLGDKPFWRTTLRLALPIALQNLLISSLTLVDTIMVGQLGDVSLAAMGMAGQLSWLMYLVLFGLSSGTAVFISQYWGIDDRKGIKRVTGIVVVSMLCVSLIFLLCGFFIPEKIIGIFNKDPGVIEQGAAYLKIAVFSYPSVAVGLAISTVLRTTENVKIPMYASAFSTVLNCGLNYVLIFGVFGLPALGIRGAAIATCISSLFSPLLMFYISYKQHNIIIGRPSEFFTFTRSSLSDFFKKSAPVIFNESSWGLGTVIFNIIFGRLGYENYAAVTIFKTFSDIAFVFFVGLCSACCVIVGKSIGAGELKKGRDDARRFAVLVPLLSLVIGCVMVIFRSYFVGLFNFSDNLTQLTFDTACAIMLVAGSELFIRNIPYILIVGVFRSGGDTVVGMRYDLICLWCISLPLTYVAAFVADLPFIAVYATMLLAEDILKAVLCIRRFRTPKWIKPVTKEGKFALANADNA